MSSPTAPNTTPTKKPLIVAAYRYGDPSRKRRVKVPPDTSWQDFLSLLCSRLEISRGVEIEICDERDIGIVSVDDLVDNELLVVKEKRGTDPKGAWGQANRWYGNREALSDPFHRPHDQAVSIPTPTVSKTASMRGRIGGGSGDSAPYIMVSTPQLSHFIQCNSFGYYFLAEADNVRIMQTPGRARKAHCIVKVPHIQDTLRILENESSLLHRISHHKSIISPPNIHIVDFSEDGHQRFFFSLPPQKQGLLRQLFSVGVAMHAYVYPLYGVTMATKIKGGLSPERVLKYVYQLVDIMHYLQQRGVIHQNLLPENIQVMSNDRVIVCNFETAIQTDPNTCLMVVSGGVAPPSNRTGLSPEVVSAFAKLRIESETVDYSTQYPWMFGVLAILIATGTHPLMDYPFKYEGEGHKIRYRSHHIQSLPNPEKYPPVFMKLVKRAMSCDPVRRPNLLQILTILKRDPRILSLMTGNRLPTERGHRNSTGSMPSNDQQGGAVSQGHRQGGVASSNDHPVAGSKVVGQNYPSSEKTFSDTPPSHPVGLTGPRPTSQAIGLTPQTSRPLALTSQASVPVTLTSQASVPMTLTSQAPVPMTLTSHAPVPMSLTSQAPVPMAMTSSSATSHVGSSATASTHIHPSVSTSHQRVNRLRLSKEPPPPSGPQSPPPTSSREQPRGANDNRVSPGFTVDPFMSLEPSQQTNRREAWCTFGDSPTLTPRATTHASIVPISPGIGRPGLQRCISSGAFSDNFTLSHSSREASRQSLTSSTLNSTPHSDTRPKSARFYASSEQLSHSHHTARRKMLARSAELLNTQSSACSEGDLKHLQDFQYQRLTHSPNTPSSRDISPSLRRRGGDLEHLINTSSPEPEGVELGSQRSLSRGAEGESWGGNQPPRKIMKTLSEGAGVGVGGSSPSLGRLGNLSSDIFQQIPMLRTNAWAEGAEAEASSDQSPDDHMTKDIPDVQEEKTTPLTSALTNRTSGAGLEGVAKENRTSGVGLEGVAKEMGVITKRTLGDGDVERSHSSPSLTPVPLPQVTTPLVPLPKVTTPPMPLPQVTSPPSPPPGALNVFPRALDSQTNLLDDFAGEPLGPPTGMEEGQGGVSHEAPPSATASTPGGAESAHSPWYESDQVTQRSSGPVPPPTSEGAERSYDAMSPIPEASQELSGSMSPHIITSTTFPPSANTTPSAASSNKHATTPADNLRSHDHVSRSHDLLAMDLMTNSEVSMASSVQAQVSAEISRRPVKMGRQEPLTTSQTTSSTSTFTTGTSSTSTSTFTTGTSTTGTSSVSGTSFSTGTSSTGTSSVSGTSFSTGSMSSPSLRNTITLSRDTARTQAQESARPLSPLATTTFNASTFQIQDPQGQGSGQSHPLQGQGSGQPRPLQGKEGGPKPLPSASVVQLRASAQGRGSGQMSYSHQRQENASRQHRISQDLEVMTLAISGMDSSASYSQPVYSHSYSRGATSEQKPPRQHRSDHHRSSTSRSQQQGSRHPPSSDHTHHPAGNMGVAPAATFRPITPTMGTPRASSAPSVGDTPLSAGYAALLTQQQQNSRKSSSHTTGHAHSTNNPVRPNSAHRQHAHSAGGQGQVFRPPQVAADSYDYLPPYSPPIAGQPNPRGQAPQQHTATSRQQQQQQQQQSEGNYPEPPPSYDAIFGGPPTTTATAGGTREQSRQRSVTSRDSSSSLGRGQTAQAADSHNSSRQGKLSSLTNLFRRGRKHTRTEGQASTDGVGVVDDYTAQWVESYSHTPRPHNVMGHTPPLTRTASSPDPALSSVTRPSEHRRSPVPSPGVSRSPLPSPGVSPLIPYRAPPPLALPENIHRVNSPLGHMGGHVPTSLSNVGGHVSSPLSHAGGRVPSPLFYSGGRVTSPLAHASGRGMSAGGLNLSLNNLSMESSHSRSKTTAGHTPSVPRVRDRQRPVSAYFPLESHAVNVPVQQLPNVSMPTNHTPHGSTQHPPRSSAHASPNNSAHATPSNSTHSTPHQHPRLVVTPTNMSASWSNIASNSTTTTTKKKKNTLRSSLRRRGSGRGFVPLRPPTGGAPRRPGGHVISAGVCVDAPGSAGPVDGVRNESRSSIAATVGSRVNGNSSPVNPPVSTTSSGSHVNPEASTASSPSPLNPTASQEPQVMSNASCPSPLNPTASQEPHVASNASSSPSLLNPTASQEPHVASNASSGLNIHALSGDSSVLSQAFPEVSSSNLPLPLSPHVRSSNNNSQSESSASNSITSSRAAARLRAESRRRSLLSTHTSSEEEGEGSHGHAHGKPKRRKSQHGMLSGGQRSQESTREERVLEVESSVTVGVVNGAASPVGVADELSIPSQAGEEQEEEMPTEIADVGSREDDPQENTIGVSADSALDVCMKTCGHTCEGVAGQVLCCVCTRKRTRGGASSVAEGECPMCQRRLAEEASTTSTPDNQPTSISYTKTTTPSHTPSSISSQDNLAHRNRSNKNCVLM